MHTSPGGVTFFRPSTAAAWCWIFVKRFTYKLMLHFRLSVQFAHTSGWLVRGRLHVMNPIFLSLPTPPGVPRVTLLTARLYRTLITYLVTAPGWKQNVCEKSDNMQTSSIKELANLGWLCLGCAKFSGWASNTIFTSVPRYFPRRRYKHLFLCGSSTDYLAELDSRLTGQQSFISSPI